MPKRKKRATRAKTRKTAKRKVRKAKSRKVAKKRTKMTPKKKAGAFNRNAYWKAFKALEARADKAWKKFQAGVKKKADPATMLRHRNELLLLLGECNYMAKECSRLAAKNKKK